MRRANDFYPTPRWATHELLKRVDVCGTVMEPCVGRGDIRFALLESPRIDRVMSNDLDRAHPADSHEDATDARWWASIRQPDWVITNPPFGVADRILPLAYRATQVGPRVAMLLRLSYLEPCEGRGAWLSQYPPTRLIVLPRISFTGDGQTDSVTCAWFVWNWAQPKGQVIEIVNPLDERQSALALGA